MDCSEAIRARRSVRKYKKGEKIPAEHIRMMLEAAMSAPSAVNSRPWEFYVTESDEIKERLMQAHPASRMLETASAAIIVCGRPDLQPKHGYWPQDCGAAVENILLQATGAGLRHLLVRVLPHRAAHFTGAGGARLREHTRRRRGGGRARRIPRAEGILRRNAREIYLT